MQQLKDASKEAWEWVSKLDPNTWCRAFFSEHPACDVLVNNWCEVFNSVIVVAHELEII